MNLPELIYQGFLRPKARPPYWRQYVQVDAGLSTSLAALIQLPQDMDAIVQSMHGRGGPFAGQTCTEINLTMTPPATPAQEIILKMENNATASLVIPITLETPLYLPRGSIIGCDAFFNSAVSSNQAILHAFVWFVPPMDV